MEMLRDTADTDISPSANGAVLGNNVHQVSCALSTDNSVVWERLLLIKHCDNEALRLETTVRESERERERDREREREREAFPVREGSSLTRTNERTKKRIDDE